MLNCTSSTDDSFGSTSSEVKGSWEHCGQNLDHVNEDAPGKYKLCYIVKHGQGDHNVKEVKSEDQEWEVSIYTLALPDLADIRSETWAST